MTNKPRHGLHEALLTGELRAALEELSDDDVSFTRALDVGEAHVVLSRHVAGVLRRVLAGDPAQQAAICNRLLGELEHQASPGDQIALPVEQLTAIVKRKPPAPAHEPARPRASLSSSALLTNATDEPSIGSELQVELASADNVDLICAFVRWYGLRVLDGPLKAFLDRGGKLRVLTTTYMGVTERKALDRLCELGAEVRIAYESKTTRLHAKAWLFRRHSGFSTAYIGSSNISRSALLDGLEWNVRVAQAESSHLLDKFRATFDSYWEGRLFEPYDPVTSAERFRAATRAEKPSTNSALATFDINPYPFQQEMLDRLWAERQRHNRWRSLVVAATGTGKTVLAALDYKRLCGKPGDLSLLFVAHRKEILQQSLLTFRHVLRDGAFGERLVDGERPEDWRHVFASIQSLKNVKFSADHFDVVIVDEFHHAAAATYRALLEHVKPNKALLGLTATPERADSESITHWFDGHIAVELRLWEALDQQLLCPFHYFGVSDNTDLSAIEWRQGGYAIDSLSNVFTGDDVRVGLIIKALHSKLPDVASMRAIGFCVSVAHAKFMAERFSQVGIPALAVLGTTEREQRKKALQMLRRGEVNILFAVDIYNEGVDVPEVDTLLLLRPTESATVFLQQLGRGLRWSDGKACCTVLDFIGQQHRRFRFDLRYQALTGRSRKETADAIEAGFPKLPAGSHFELDRVARRQILDNIRASLPHNRKAMAFELAVMKREVGLAEFLRETMQEPEDLYRKAGWSWTETRRMAGLPTPEAGPNEEMLLKAMGRLLHVNDPERVEFYRETLVGAMPPKVDSLSVRKQRLLAMLHFGLRGVRQGWKNLQASMDDLWSHGAVRAELVELLGVLDARSQSMPKPLGLLLPVPLSVSAEYSRDEILAAFGVLKVDRPTSLQAGVFYDKETRTDLFFVTLHKTEKHFSPTTRYEDYPISPGLFHWQSQGATSVESATGRRYLGQGEAGTNVVLFVRESRKDPRGETRPFVCLGPADLERAEGSRPISVVWRLRVPASAGWFERAKVVAG